MQGPVIEAISHEMIFVRHPLLKLHTVFYLKPRKQLIFIKEMAGKCGKFETGEPFDYPALTDEVILELINLFDRKESLLSLYHLFSLHNGSLLDLQQFKEIVWLLNKHNLILDCRNFTGFLGGIGRLNFS